MIRFVTRREHGVAMVLVLWMVALLTVIAGSFVFAMHTDAQVVQNSIFLARAEAAANAGVHRALYEFYKPFSDAERWKADGEMHELMLNGALVRVSALDESGKIDINTAAEALLKGMFLSVGVQEDAATALVDAMQDWRDSDSLTRPHGAEEAEYRAAGLKYKPANAPFQTIEELQLVLGMTPEIYRRVAGIITVYSRQPGINVTIAAREVLLALPGASAEQVDAYIAQRESARAAKQPLPFFPPAARFVGMANNLTFSLRAEAKLEDGTIFVRDAVAQILPDPKRPYTFLAWKDAAPGTGQDRNDKTMTQDVQSN
jgi:general secretion pathway protein K